MMEPQNVIARVPGVLVVEDETLLWHLLEVLLEGAGFHVVIAADGKQALEGLSQQTEDIDVAVVDWHLPDLGGVAIIREMRRLRPNLPCLILTGESDPGHPLIVGVPILHKPLDLMELPKKLRELLELPPGQTTQRPAS